MKKWRVRHKERMTIIFTLLVGQSRRSALKSWAAQQRRPVEDVEFLVLHPDTIHGQFMNAPAHCGLFWIAKYEYPTEVV